MFIEKFTYRVGLELTFTSDEVALMLEVAESHYDGACKHDTPKILNWHRHVFEVQETDDDVADPKERFTFRQLDTLCKVMEMSRYLPEDRAAAGFGLYIALKRALGTINAEHTRLAETAQPVPRPGF